jgi:hypothetical protein
LIPGAFAATIPRTEDMMRIHALLFLIAGLALSLTAAGCRPGALLVLDDDDDDDASGDDDTGDDDDTADDDDDDDDTADDDDDTDDDDDDDDDIPLTPGIRFTVESGDYAGDYSFEEDISCGPTEEGPGIWATSDYSWENGFVIGFEGPPPDAGGHVTQLYMYWWWDGWYGGSAWGAGGISCYLDTLGPWPGTSGTFACDLMWVDDLGNGEEIAIVDGMVRCP